MPTRPSSVIRSGGVVLAAALPRSATHTTGNSRPLARWIVISRTASSVLGLQRRLALALGDQVALGHEVDEAAQVAALLGLELARHPHQLAHVGHPPLAGGHRQHCAVIARARHRPVDQRLQGHPRRRALASARERAGERASAARQLAAGAGRRAAPVGSSAIDPPDATGPPRVAAAASTTRASSDTPPSGEASTEYSASSSSGLARAAR